MILQINNEGMRDTKSEGDGGGGVQRALCTVATLLMMHITAATIMKKTSVCINICCMSLVCLLLVAVPGNGADK